MRASATILLLPASHSFVCGFVTQHPSNGRPSSAGGAGIHGATNHVSANRAPSNAHVDSHPSSTSLLLSEYLDDESSYAFFQRRTSPSLSNPNKYTLKDDDKRDVVRKWLLFHLPKLKPRDVEEYTKVLMGDGFDSAEMLTEVRGDDLGFMKVAHQRVLIAKLTKGRGTEQAMGVANALKVLGPGETATESSNAPTKMEEECDGEEECFDITQSRFPERRMSLSTGLLPSNTASAAVTSKKRIYPRVREESTITSHISENNTECEGEEDCFDITQSRFPERKTTSLSTGLPPSNRVADVSNKKKPVVHDQKQSSESPNQVEEECDEEDDCFDITQSKFPERTKSLSTGLSPSNSQRLISKNSEVKDFLPTRKSDGYYDITQNMFPERQRSASTFTDLASGNSGKEGKPISERTQDPFFDITQHLFPESPQTSMSTNRLVSAFEDAEKSEMNSRPPPQSMGAADTTNQLSSNSGTVKSIASVSKPNVTSNRTKSADNQDIEESRSVDDVDAINLRTGKERFPESKQPKNEYVDITKQHFTTDRPSSYVNIGGRRRSASKSEPTDDYIDITKQHFPDRSTFSQLVNSGTKKDGTTYGSWDESRLLPMPERTKDASWRWQKTPRSAYLDQPKFSSDLSPSSPGKPGLPQSRKASSTMANVEPKQRFNTTEESYRHVVTLSDRQPLSATANTLTQQRFNTSQEIYRDSSVQVKREPLSSRANVASQQRFNTVDANSDGPESSGRRSSIAYAPPRQRFKTSEQGYKDNLVLSTREPLNVNGLPVQRFKTKEKPESAIRQPLTFSAQSSTNRFNMTGRQTMFTSTAAVDSKSVQPLSTTVHLTNDRFNTTKTTSSFSSNQTMGFDLPRAFVYTDKVSKFESPRGKNQHVDEIKFSTNLSTSTRVKNLTQQVKRDSSEQFNPDANEFLSILSQSMTVRDVDYTQTTPNSDSQFVDNLNRSPTQQHKTDSVITPTSHLHDAYFVDKNQFSPDLTRVSTATHKPGSAIKSSPHHQAGENLGIDLNEFSSVAKLSPPSKVKVVKSGSESRKDSADQLLDLSSRHTVNDRASKSRHSAAAVVSDDPFVDIAQFSAPETLIGPLKVKNLNTPVGDKDDIGVDMVQFSPADKLRPPSQIRQVKPKQTVAQVPTKRAPHVNSYFQQLSLVNKPEAKMREDEILVDRLLDLSTQYTVNNSSMTALGSHAIVSDDPYVNKPSFSSPYHLSPPSKVQTYRTDTEQEEYFDITQESLSSGKLTRNVSSVRDAILARKVNSDQDEASFRLLRNVSSIRDASSASKVKSPVEIFDSSDDEVKHWLISRLPQLDTDSVTAYTEQLIADGFDSIDMLAEVIEDDLHFMKEDHRESLLFSMDLKYWLLAYLPDLVDTDIESYSRHLIDDGFDSFEMLDELTIDDVKFMKASHRYVLAKQLNASGNSGETEEIAFDITRDPFSDRPSLASAPNHHLTSLTRAPQSTDLQDVEEVSYDITRTLFPERPSLATPQQHLETFDEVQSNEESVFVKSHVQQRQPLAPKAELNQFYVSSGLTPEQASELKDFYSVWQNEENKFTCVFTCPISGEHFLAGEWKDHGDVISDGQLYWYQTKKSAQHAAAAKALDCISLLKCEGTDASPVQRCLDAPYATEETHLSTLLPSGMDLPISRYRLEEDT